ncbi:F-box/FBD/LRR-repeat protein At5g53840-like [Lolium rigidum]|uniref:F-box/FBD/LRR-repeat protein At5g53840-like n=1 Tax=Lolium rigidum TaxID=89674 RepID=UPI001F5CCA7C|nr:F-box/FBD/LRR-repeat protein At5g53840-like [Lolium rigidum]
METAPKKMRPAALEAPGGTEAGVQAPPPEDEDRISQLPDAVLGDIISLLPTKEGARSQILATRWRRLWGSSSAPLNLDCNALRRPAGSSDIFESAVSSILSAHPGPGRRFCLDETRRPYPRSDEALVDSWLSSPALHNLQHLELRHDYTSSYPSYNQPPPPPLRAAAFRFARTLRVATFGSCALPSQPPHFPNLKLLTLEKASISSDCSLHNMISQCPTLECLLLHDVYGIPCARISSQSLKSIGVRFGWFRVSEDQELEELLIENAPSLEKLLNLNCIHVTVVSAPKLEILGRVSDSNKNKTRLVFGSTVIQGFRVDSMAARICTVKTLAVNMGNQLSVKKAIAMLRCFPCLEKLYIKFCWEKEIMYRCTTMSIWRDMMEPRLDIPLKLKKIVCDLYQGFSSQIEFARFFVLNATELESIIFEVEDKYYNKEFFAYQRAALQCEKRVSRGACYQFTTRRCLRGVDEFNHASDLDLTDPFLKRGSRGSSCRFV